MTVQPSQRPGWTLCRKARLVTRITAQGPRSHVSRAAPSETQDAANYPSYSFRTKFYRGGMKRGLPSPSSLEGAEQAQEPGAGLVLRSSSPSPCRYPRASAWPPVSGLGTHWALETSHRPGGAPWSPCWSQVLSFLPQAPPDVCAGLPRLARGLLSHGAVSLCFSSRALCGRLLCPAVQL